MADEKDAEPMAQLYDRFLNRSAVGMFLVALMFAYSAVEQVLGGNLPLFLNYAEKMLAILVVIVVAPVTFKVYWRKRSLLGSCSEPEGFLTTIFQKAATRAFTGGFLALMVLYVLFEKQMVSWPAAVLVPALLAFNLMVASVSFFLDNLSDDESDFDDEDDLGAEVEQ